MATYKRTSEEQSIRSKTGVKAEYKIRNKLKEKGYKVRVYKNGPDIRGTDPDGKPFVLESKSVFPTQKEDGSIRQSRYTIKVGDLQNSEYIAFSVKYWNGDVKETHITKSENVIDWLKAKNKFQTGKSTKITISKTKDFPAARLKSGDSVKLKIVKK